MIRPAARPAAAPRRPEPGPALRLGVLGCAGIANAFVRDVAGSPWVTVVAAASRDLARAEAFARQHGIGRAHGSYEALLADPGIDAVYLPLPNSLHATWAIRAAEARKHVLCEKPLALDRAEAEAMFAAARRHGVVLLEAFPWWFQPATGKLVAQLADGAIGAVRSVQASFGFTLPNPATNIRLVPELGGGALLDAGSYPLSLVRLVMGDAPQQVVAQSRWHASGIDIGTSATLLWDDGRRAQVSCAMDGAMHRHATVVGSAGTLETDYLNHVADAPGHPLGWQPNRMRLRRGTAGTVPFEALHAPGGSGFRFEAEAFAQLVARGDSAAFERAAAASCDIAAMLQAIAASARSGRPEPVPGATQRSGSAASGAAPGPDGEAAARLAPFAITRQWPAQHPDRLQLYSLPTPNGVKVSIMLEEIGLPYEAHSVSFDRQEQLSPAFLSLNPNNKIPAILDPHGPGGQPLPLFESGAILLYLAEKTGLLLPAAPAARWQAVQWLMFQMGGVGPMFGQLGYFHKFAGRDIEDKRPRDRYVAEARRLLRVLEGQVTGRDWLLGPHYTVADIAVMPWVRNLVGFYGAGDLVGWADFPQLQRVLAAFEARPAVQRGLLVPARG